MSAAPSRPAQLSSSTRDALALAAAAAGLVTGLLLASAAHATDRSEPALPLSHLEQGRWHVQAGDDRRALFHLRRHVEAAPADTAARALLAGTCARLGLRHAALFELHLVLAADPTDEEALLALARLQADLGEHEALVLTVGRLRRAGATHAELDVLEGAALARLGRHEEAEAPLTAALQRAPDDPDLLATWALSALRLGGRDRVLAARDALVRAAALRPDRASVRNSLGFAEEALGDGEAAYLAYLEAEALAPGDASYAANRRRLEAHLTGH